MKRRIVLLGPPASGKGTQAELIERKFKLPGTSTGAILRQEARAGTPRGLLAHGFVVKGGFAPDELILEVVSDWLDRSGGSFLFDGFPRTLRQAQEFDQLLSKRGWPLELALYLDASLATIQQRMSHRLTCRDCGKVVSIGRNVKGLEDPCPNCGGQLEQREDDRQDVLARRMKEFEEKTLPVTDFYREQGILVSIDSNAEVERVFQTISETIEK